MSSCSCRWKRRGWLREDMVEIAADARARIVRKQEGTKAPGANSKSQKCERRRKGTAASGEGKCKKVANPCGTCL
jgi:hypothetical protein